MLFPSSFWEESGSGSSSPWLYGLSLVMCKGQSRHRSAHQPCWGEMSFDRHNGTRLWGLSLRNVFWVCACSEMGYFGGSCEINSLYMDSTSIFPEWQNCLQSGYKRCMCRYEGFEPKVPLTHRACGLQQEVSAHFACVLSMWKFLKKRKKTTFGLRWESGRGRGV